MDTIKDRVKRKLKRDGEGRRRTNCIAIDLRLDVQDATERNSPISNRRVLKTIPRGEFLLSYLSDIRDAFGLNDSQIRVLLALTTSNEYKGEFVWRRDSVSHVSSLCGDNKFSVMEAFSLLVSRKGLIVKIKNGLYKLNDNVLYHASKITKVDCVQVTLSYRFADARPTVESLLERGTDISLELVEALREEGERTKEKINRTLAIVQDAYNINQREKIKRESESKAKQAEKEIAKEQLSKNKWE